MQKLEISKILNFFFGFFMKFSKVVHGSFKNNFVSIKNLEKCDKFFLIICQHIELCIHFAFQVNALALIENQIPPPK